MLYATGLVMAVKDDSYVNASQQNVPQVTLAVFDQSSGELMPALITFGQDYASDLSKSRALFDLQGKIVTVPFRIMAFKNGGFKLLATSLPKVQSDSKAA